MKNDKLTRILENLGLSDNEANVYLASLSIGPSTILKIAQASEIKRTTVYSVIEALKQKGLIRMEIKGFKQLYAPESPEKLEGMINSSRDQLVHSLPEFMALYNLEGGESFIKYYEGVEACKTVYENQIKESSPGDFLLVISEPEKWYSHDPEFFSSFLDKRSKLSIKVRKLFQFNGNPEKQTWWRPGIDDQTKLLPKQTKLTTNLFVTPRKVVIQQLTPPIIAIEIENKSVVQMNKEMFEIMWRSIPGQRGDDEKINYDRFTELQLNELEDALKTVLRDGMNIVDVGGSYGNTVNMINENASGCQIIAVNQDKKFLTEITESDSQLSRVTVAEQSPEQFFAEKHDKNFDLVIFRFSPHEIIDSQDQSRNLSELLTRVKSLLKPGGKIIISDFFYDPGVTNQELEIFRKYLMENIGHADPREQFINPDLILEAAQDLNFKILHFHQNRAVKEIDRRYYVFILENKE